MTQRKITAKQQEILDYIKEEILKKGYPPAVREICEAAHLKSTSSVHSHLRRWRRTDISAGTRLSRARLRSQTTAFRLFAQR